MNFFCQLFKVMNIRLLVVFHLKYTHLNHISDFYRPLGDGKSKQKMRQGKNVRLNINARERRRMHDLVSYRKIEILY